MIAFGPVPSRRLGRSLGINNIPPKVCTYACVYCQLGRTLKMQVERRAFYEPAKILWDVEDRVKAASAAGERIDFLTFVPDGEPTLDLNLGLEIERLRSLGIKIAVITNASLLRNNDVQEALMKADWVSLKIDSVNEKIWRQVDRPHSKLQHSAIVEGTLEFARAFGGELVTETMLVRGVNDGAEEIGAIAGLLAQVKPTTAHLAVPTRPPAENWARPPTEQMINQAYQILAQKVDQVELLIGYEGNAFAFMGNVEEDLLSITAVHPMRKDAVDELLARAGAQWTVVGDLLTHGQLIEATYGGQRFFLRNLHH